MTGNLLTWGEWTAILSEAAGQTIPFTEVSAEVMIDLGRRFDEHRESGREGLPPISLEAAVIMTSGEPADDSATLRDLGITFRPGLATFHDMLECLHSAEQLAPPD